jgi:adenylate cyclase
VSVVSINGKTGPALKLPDSPNQWPRTKHADLIKALTARDVDGIVFAIDFNHAKPEDEEFAKAIAMADRVILFEWLFQGRGVSYASDKRRSATEILARAAKALGPFPVPKRDQAVFQFWAFKGGVPITTAIALQLKALPLYEQWLSVLKEAQAPNLESLPVNARGLKAPEDMQG